MEKKSSAKVPGALRHRLVWAILRPFAVLYMRIKFHFKTETLKTNEPTIILCNHTTEKDMMMCMCAFPKHMYFVAGEHLTTRKTYPLLDCFLHMIMMYKGDSDLAAVKEIVKRLKAGHNILLFPEGSRSFNGETEALSESIGKLCRMGKCGVITYRTSGGYFAEPRWAYTVRQGHLEGHIIRHLSAEEVRSMKADELTRLINEDLHENAYERQRREMRPYRGERLAEGLENYLLICPACGAYESLTTKDNTFCCTACGMNGIYDEYGFLKGDGLAYDSVYDWGIWVKEKFARDLCEKKSARCGAPAAEEPGEAALYADSGIKFYEIMADHERKEQPGEEIRCYFDRLNVCGQTFAYEGITGMSMLYYGKTLLFTYKGRHFGVTGESFHALKYQYTWDFYKEETHA